MPDKNPITCGEWSREERAMAEHALGITPARSEGLDEFSAGNLGVLTMPAYRIIKLSCVGNDRDGYEVNDASDTGYVAEFPETASNRDIMSAMKACGYLARRPQTRHLCFENDYGCNHITITQRSTGRCLWELRLSELIADDYDNRECTDCGDPIPLFTERGESCSNCQHVFTGNAPTDD